MEEETLEKRAVALYYMVWVRLASFPDAVRRYTCAPYTTCTSPLEAQPTHVALSNGRSETHGALVEFRIDMKSCHDCLPMHGASNDQALGIQSAGTWLQWWYQPVCS